MNELLLRENNLLENLIQIYKHFIKLDTTNEGHVQLKKKLCIVESLKLYVEHLTLFHKYDLLIMPPSNLNESIALAASDPQYVPVTNKNYTKEMIINFKVIQNRWLERRKEQLEHKKNSTAAKNLTDIEKRYPFTYLIDCLMEECLLYANTSKYFTSNISVIKENEEAAYANIYPPQTLNQLLEICLECNLSTKMKQIIILYALCDLMHTELMAPVQSHVLKLINAYCSTKFTLMSTKLDVNSSAHIALSGSGVGAMGDQENIDNSSCLFDLVNGLYLIDNCRIEKAFKYLRAAELNYLEFYEKYFILYNSCNCNQYNIASQYLWLFQKLNASSIGSTDMNNGNNNETNRLR